MSSTAIATTASGGTAQRPNLSEATRKAIERDSKELDTIHLRLAFVESVRAVLVETTRSRDFLVGNLPLYWAILGERDMVAIRLASWAKGFTSDGGLLATLTKDDVAGLSFAWAGTNRPDGGW